MLPLGVRAAGKREFLAPPREGKVPRTRQEGGGLGGRDSCLQGAGLNTHACSTDPHISAMFEIHACQVLHA